MSSGGSNAGVTKKKVCARKNPSCFWHSTAEIAQWHYKAIINAQMCADGQTLCLQERPQGHT